MQASGSSGQALSSQQARQAPVCKGGKAAWQKGRKEEKSGIGEANRCDLFAKVAPRVTGVAVSLQGFAGIKLWITADQNSIAESCQLHPMGLFLMKVWVGQTL